MNSIPCSNCGAEIPKHALLCPNCKSIGFVARGNTPAKRAAGLVMIAAGILAALFIQIEAGTFADKSISFLEGFIVGLGIVITLVIPGRKNQGDKQ